MMTEQAEIDVFICPKCYETLEHSALGKFYFCTCGFRSDTCEY